ncbi:MAG: hypothetical protein M5U27_16165 [Gaiella sp.]|nr:hypothetical protein [Gaiella sp.]
MEWAQVATIVGVFTAVIGLQSFWIARSIDGLRSEVYRGFDSVERRFDNVERRLDRLEDREPPSLRRA